MMKFQVLGVAGLVGKGFELDRIVTTEEAHTLSAIASFQRSIAVLCLRLLLEEFRRSHLGSDPRLLREVGDLRFGRSLFLAQITKL